MTDGLKFKKGDLLAIALVSMIALCVFIAYLPKGLAAQCRAEIYRDGELIDVISLNEPQELVIESSYKNVITVQDNRIAITESDCPGEDCVHSGFIGTPNRSIVCLPNAVEIRIVADEADVDFVVR